jgi:hypothetical protein
LDIGEDDRPEDYFDNDDGFEEFKKDKPLGVQQAVVKVITERYKYFVLFCANLNMIVIST